MKGKTLCWLAASVLVLLAGCTLGGPRTPLSILAPNVTLQADSSWPEVDWSIQIQRPVADQMRDSDRLLVRRTPSRLQVYSGAVWLDQVPDMLQSVLIQSFEDAGRFDGVGRAGGIRTRYVLATEIRHFEAVDDGGPDLKVELVIQSSLIHQRSARAIATRTVRQEVDSSGKTLDPLIAAFESALAGLIGELVGWSLEQGQRHEAWFQRAADEAGDRPADRGREGGRRRR